MTILGTRDRKLGLGAIATMSLALLVVTARVGWQMIEHFPHNRDASVATLQWCSGSSLNAVRIPSGIGVQLRRNSPLDETNIREMASRPNSIA
jgi:hypothetical protein